MSERTSSQLRGSEAAPSVVIRPLAYPDLPEVLAIERRVFPTPWSLAMFVLELSKQTGICLAATERANVGAGTAEQDRLIGYLICSRYDTVWHVMNVAVDLHRQRMGLATQMLAELYARVDDEQRDLGVDVHRQRK